MGGPRQVRSYPDDTHSSSDPSCAPVSVFLHFFNEAKLCSNNEKRRKSCAPRSNVPAGENHGQEQWCKVSNILHFLAMPDFHDWGIIVIHAALSLRPAVSCITPEDE